MKNTILQSEASVINWLLNSDPAIRWQVLQDLCSAEANLVEKERHNIVGYPIGNQPLQVDWF